MTPSPTEAPKMSAADKLILIGMRGAKLFHTPDGTPYGGIRVESGGMGVHPIKSEEFKSRMVREYFKSEGKGASGEGMKTAITTIDAIARGEEEITLHNRVMQDGDRIMYDMSNDDCEVVSISKDGWSLGVVDTPMFMRYAHQSPQMHPVEGGKLEEIFDVLNVVPSDRLMTMVHMVSSLIPDIPHTIPNIKGEHGSAKSAASNMMVALIDPSILPAAGMPNNEDGMHQVLSHHWYVIFDNVSWVQDWQSEIMCMASTGAARAKRALWTDDSDFIQVYKNCVGMNGITYLATRGDLLDRSIGIALRPLTGTGRETVEEGAIKARFNEMKPRLLGAMFDALSKAMVIHPTVRIENKPRMADFAVWGCAIAEALGYTQGEFMRAYRADISASDQRAIDSTPIADLIIRLMTMRGVEEWVGTPKELWRALGGILDEDEVKRSDVKGMGNTVSLGKAMDRVAPNLRKMGISWTKVEKGGHKIIYTISNTKTTPIKSGGVERLEGCASY